MENASSEENAENYRCSPFTIQAAAKGSYESLKHLVNGGCDITEDIGHICLSRRRMNAVQSNVIGAAAYHGHSHFLQRTLQLLPKEAIDLPAIESSDRRQVKGGPF